MLETIVGLFWTVALVYAGLGLGFAVPFVLFWSGRIDSAARGGSWGFRLAIVPGTIAFWPLLALRTLRAFRRSAFCPDPERPVSPGTQRSIHGIAFVALAAGVPAICTVALLDRPQIESSVASQLQSAPLPDILPLETRALPVTASLRTDGNRYQVELEVSGPFDEPIVALYWNPGNEASDPAGTRTFLGSVWGPSHLLFNLPLNGHLTSGTLTFIALSGDQRILGTIPVGLK